MTAVTRQATARELAEHVARVDRARVASAVRRKPCLECSARANVPCQADPAADHLGRAVDPASADRRRLAGHPDRHHFGFAGQAAVRSDS